MSDLHHDAIVTRLKEHVQLASSVYELGEVPTFPTGSTPRYVVLASSPGDWEQARVTGGKVALRTTETLYCVGASQSAARKVATWVETQMKDHRLTVAGRNVFKPDPWLSRPAQIDKDGIIKLPFVTIQFDVYSEPA